MSRDYYYTINDMKWEILYQRQRALLEAEKKQEEDLLRLIKEERVRLNQWDENEFGTECP